MPLLLIAVAFAGSGSGGQWGAGWLTQGIRPGVVVERTFALPRKSDKPPANLLVPTLSGWVHPGHYVPLQAHLHYVNRLYAGERWFMETSLGLGGTWVLNARRTVRIEDGVARTVPLASHLVASPTVGAAVGRRGDRWDGLVRLRLGYWVPWQHSYALSWNLEAVVRVGKQR